MSEGRRVNVLLSVPEASEELRECDGYTFIPASSRTPIRIYLNARQSPAQLRLTYLHELLHLAAESLNIPYSREEPIVETVSRRLLPILKRYALKLPVPSGSSRSAA